MPTITLDAIQAYRAETFRLRPGLRIANKEQAVAFVNQRGYVYFWPIKEVTLPSLWVAVAGDRPVPDEHDDPGHVTWGWKDELLGERRCYYAKLLRRRATFVALDVAPALLRPFGELRRANTGLSGSISRGAHDLGGQDPLRNDPDRRPA